MFRWLYCPEPQRKRPNQATITQPGHPKKKHTRILSRLTNKRAARCAGGVIVEIFFHEIGKYLGILPPILLFMALDDIFQRPLKLATVQPVATKSFALPFFFSIESLCIFSLDRVALHFFARGFLISFDLGAVKSDGFYAIWLTSSLVSRGEVLLRALNHISSFRVIVIEIENVHLCHSLYGLWCLLL